MSHNCEHEHDHGHGHDDNPPLPTAEAQSLFPFINTPNVRCFNAVGHGSNDLSKCFLKSQDDKCDVSKYLGSDADCQLILHIPFTVVCRVFSLVVRFSRTGNGIGSPKTIKIFKNYNKSIDFDTIADSKPVHTIENPENAGIDGDVADSVATVGDEYGFVEHFLPRQHFQNAESLTVLIEDNWSGDEDDLTRCFYLELRGENSGQKRTNDGVPLLAVYEAAPNPLDHQRVDEVGGSTLGV
ncbi:LADA_0C09318g1_1 [Lachancea dasiensis]|uniref:LADA_0C09318g1_1 n=1 Tax=Lachancea dasiensis TaxID=1072105 RepID=A0A1G4J0E3_9SACH|nr:LADA_0C09318g1_1 [Lachancea dasiensis]